MREIKFRAWDKREDKMVESFMLAPTSPYWAAFPIEVPDDELRHDLRKYDLRHGDELHGDYSLMDWSNYYGMNYEVMQFTGLKDKNGKEIYDGDIVKLWSKSVGDRWYCSLTTSVVWSDSGLNWNVYPHHDKDHTWEVIGNIYENPELLK